MSSFHTLTLTFTLILTLSLTLPLITLSQPAEAEAQVRPRPNPSGNAAVFARWLVSQSSWGGLATIDAGAAVPFNNVISFADGDTGVPFFYLSKLDPTGGNAANGSLASFTLSEAVLGFCGAEDPQSPACARITLSGTLKLLNGAEAEFGEAALFAKHPQFMGFPKMMGFQVYEMGINYIYLLNEKARSKKLAVEDYLRANFG